MKWSVLIFIFISFSLLCFHSFTFAQDETTGAISGHVYDAENLIPLEGVWITARISSGVVFAGYERSEADGSYIITNLPVGEYWVEANADGYILQNFDKAIIWDDVDLA